MVGVTVRPVTSFFFQWRHQHDEQFPTLICCYPVFFHSGHVCMSSRRERPPARSSPPAVPSASPTTSRRPTSAGATSKSCASARTDDSSAPRMATASACWPSTRAAASWPTACPSRPAASGRSALSTRTATWCSPPSSPRHTASWPRAASVDASPFTSPSFSKERCAADLGREVLIRAPAQI